MSRRVLYVSGTPSVDGRVFRGDFTFFNGKKQEQARSGHPLDPRLRKPAEGATDSSQKDPRRIYPRSKSPSTAIIEAMDEANINESREPLDCYAALREKMQPGFLGALKNADAQSFHQQPRAPYRILPFSLFTEARESINEKKRKTNFTEQSRKKSRRTTPERPSSLSGSTSSSSSFSSSSSSSMRPSLSMEPLTETEKRGSAPPELPQPIVEVSVTNAPSRKGRPLVAMSEGKILEIDIQEVDKSFLDEVTTKSLPVAEISASPATAPTPELSCSALPTSTTLEHPEKTENATPVRPTPSATSKKRKSRPMCFDCHKRGHTHRECPNPTGNPFCTQCPLPLPKSGICPTHGAASTSLPGNPIAKTIPPSPLMLVQPLYPPYRVPHPPPLDVSLLPAMWMPPMPTNRDHLF